MLVYHVFNDRVYIQVDEIVIFLVLNLVLRIV